MMSSVLRIQRLGSSALPTAALLIVAAFLADSAWLVDATFIPTHDTCVALLHFHYAYFNLVEYGDLPRWTPHVNYGVPSLALMQAVLTPSDYVAMALGAAFRTTNVLLLHKAAIFADRVLFVCGMYFLARRLLRSHHAVLLVGMLAALMPLWYSNVAHAFRIYYLLPFALLALHSFATTRRPEFFWLSGLFAIIALVGNAIYAAPLYAMTLTCFFLPLMPSMLDMKRALLARTWAHVIAAAAFGIACSTLIVVVCLAFNGMAVVSPGRNAGGGVALRHFLSDVPVSISAVVYMLSHGWPVFSELSLYAGLLPWWAAVWGLIKLRSREFAAISVPLIVLLVVGLTDLGATAAFYSAPLMCYFRPIRYVIGTAIGVFLPLAAGFGIDSLMRQSLHERLLWLLVALNGTVLIWFTSDALFFAEAMSTVYADQGCLPDLGPMSMASVRLLFYFLALIPLVHEYVTSVTVWHRSAWARILVCALACDLTLYRVQVMVTGRQATVTDAKRFTSPWSLQYIPQRECTERVTWLPNPPSTFYDQLYVFQNIDPCLPLARSQIMTEGVSSLLTLKLAPPSAIAVVLSELGAPHYSTSSQQEAWMRASASGRLDDAVLQHVLACCSPKLQFYSQVMIAASVDEARRFVAKSRRIDKVPVVIAEDAVVQRAGRDAECVATVDAFSPNDIVINVWNPGSEGVWLVYSDAFHPEWHCTIDAASQQTAVVNLGFKGIHVPPGMHRVRWRFGGLGRRFAHNALSIGAATALAGALALLLLGNKQPANDRECDR